MNPPEAEQTTASNWVSVMPTRWSRRAKLITAVSTVAGMVLFTVTLLVPIIITQSKYTTATTYTNSTITSTTTPTTTTATITTTTNNIVSTTTNTDSTTTTNTLSTTATMGFTTASTTDTTTSTTATGRSTTASTDTTTMTTAAGSSTTASTDTTTMTTATGYTTASTTDSTTSTTATGSSTTASTDTATMTTATGSTAASTTDSTTMTTATGSSTTASTDATTSTTATASTTAANTDTTTSTTVTVSASTAKTDTVTSPTTAGVTTTVSGTALASTTITESTASSSSDTTTSTSATETATSATTVAATSTTTLELTTAGNTYTTTSTTESSTTLTTVAATSTPVTTTSTTVTTTSTADSSTGITETVSTATASTSSATTESITTMTTTTTGVVLPPFLNVQPGTVYAVWNTFAGGISTLATESSTGSGTYFTGKSPNNLFDDKLSTIYSARGFSSSGVNLYAGLGTGFYMTVAQCQPVLLGFQFGHAYNLSEREPLTVTVEGTNCVNLLSCLSWTLLYTGSTGLDIQVNSSQYGKYQSISNSVIYNSYRFLTTSKRNSSNFISYSEVQLFGYSSQTSSQTSAANSTSLLVVQSGSVQGIWNTVAGGKSTIATANTSGVGTYPSNQSPDTLFDGNTNTKYLSRGNSSGGINALAGLNTGFYLTIAHCQPTLVKFRFATASNGFAPYGDPTAITVEGTNCNTLINCTTWTTIYTGATGLESFVNRSTYGPFQNISLLQTYTSYRFLVTAKRNNSNSVAYSEVELYGY
ncbi:unnamed protein product [Rotaria magnacalcarata]|uniref:Uncharacterized protein n=1 Tax=Rotaria magnacalcarata TaxID=392030 RepID=A0A816LKH4_9BILA|nr:unnamed protein product [Rotaria magnacalcarata]